MDNKDFNKIIEAQLNRCMQMLSEKGSEYDSDNADRLGSFKRGAAVLNSTPKQVLAGYMNKHIVSIYDMCRSQGSYSPETWNEKITDAINYLLLLRAMVEEETVNE